MFFDHPETGEVQSVTPGGGRGKFKPGTMYGEGCRINAKDYHATMDTMMTGVEFRETRGLASLTVVGDMLIISH